MPGVSLFRGLELGNVRHQLFFVGPADEVEAAHLHRALRRLASRPQRNQHADDDGQVHLDFDAVGPMAEQVSTAQNVLVETKEQFHGPAFSVDQRDHFGRKVEQVGCNQQEVALLRPAPAVVPTALAVRRAGDLDDSLGTLGADAVLDFFFGWVDARNLDFSWCQSVVNRSPLSRRAAARIRSNALCESWP